MDWEIFGDDEFADCMDKTSKTENFFTVFINRNWIPQLVKRQYRSGFPSLNTLKENFITVFEGYAFVQYSPYYEEFNEKIGRMLSSGLIDYWISNFIPGWRDKIQMDEVGPQILSIEHLEIGFYICMVPLALAAIVFLVEMLYPCLKEQLAKMALFLVIKDFVRKHHF